MTSRWQMGKQGPGSLGAHLGPHTGAEATLKLHMAVCTHLLSCPRGHRSPVLSGPEALEWVAAQMWELCDLGVVKEWPKSIALWQGGQLGSILVVTTPLQLMQTLCSKE